MDTIHVSTFSPKNKHRYIFERFALLEEGESLIILNDHDPLPLYYQLLILKGDNVGWEYLQKGPDKWKVKITNGKTADCLQETI